MNYAFRCTQTGLVDWTDSSDPVKCSFCGETHEVFETGAPPAEDGTPNIIGDKLLKHMDWAAGCEITSKSQRRRIYAQKGLHEKSYAEEKRKHGGMEKTGTVYSYAGQTNHTSSAEKIQ